MLAFTFGFRNMPNQQKRTPKSFKKMLNVYLKWQNCSIRWKIFTITSPSFLQSHLNKKKVWSFWQFMQARALNSNMSSCPFGSRVSFQIAEIVKIWRKKSKRNEDSLSLAVPALARLYTFLIIRETTANTSNFTALFFKNHRCLLTKLLEFDLKFTSF